jgi:transcriptional regulator with XRE-family HTH domain
MTTFGGLVRERRVAHGMTQAELGDPHYSASYISHLESGRRKPTHEVLTHVADRLDLDVSRLVVAVETELELSESVRLALLQDRARQAWERHDYDVTAAEAEVAATYAAEQRRPDEWWALSLLRARALLTLERYEECWTLALHLAEHSWADRSPVFACQALILASKALRADGVGNRAISVGQQAAQRSRELPAESVERVQALSALISAQAEFGDLEDVATEIDELASLFDQSSELRASAEAGWTLGNVAFMRGDIAAGLNYHEATSRHLSPMSDLRAWGRFHKATAQMRVTAAAPDGAAEHLDLARRALDLVGNRSDLEELDRTSAELLLLDGDPDGALALLDPLAERAEEIPPHEWGRVQLLRVRAFEENGRIELARDCAASAARALSHAGAHQLALDAWEKFSQLQENSKETTRAEDRVDQLGTTGP